MVAYYTNFKFRIKGGSSSIVFKQESVGLTAFSLIEKDTRITLP